MKTRHKTSKPQHLKCTSIRSIFLVSACCCGPVWWITFWLHNTDWLIQSKIHHMFMFLRKVETHLKLDLAGQGLVSDSRSTSQWSLLQTHCWWSIVQLLQWDRPLWHLPPIPALHQQDFFFFPSKLHSILSGGYYFFTPAWSLQKVISCSTGNTILSDNASMSLELTSETDYQQKTLVIYSCSFFFSFGPTFLGCISALFISERNGA